MRPIHRKLGRAALAFATGLAVLGAWTLGALAETTLEKIKREKVFKIGFANEAPFGHMTPDGKLTGEAPEVARVVIAKLGDVKIEGVLTEFGSLIPGIKAGRFDMIAAGMFILPKRCKEIAFSNPTLGLSQAFAVKKGNPKKLNSFEDVAKHADAKIVVVAGGVEREYATKTGIPDDRVVVAPDFPTATAALQTGRVDAIALTGPSIQNIIDTAKDPNIERAKPFADPMIDGATVRKYTGFGFRQEDKDLVAFFNAELAKFIGSPEHKKLIGGFGFTDDEQPGKAMTDQECKG